MAQSSSKIIFILRWQLTNSNYFLAHSNKSRVALTTNLITNSVSWENFLGSRIIDRCNVQWSTISKKFKINQYIIFLSQLPKMLHWHFFSFPSFMILTGRKHLFSDMLHLMNRFFHIMPFLKIVPSNFLSSRDYSIYYTWSWFMLRSWLIYLVPRDFKRFW